MNKKFSIVLVSACSIGALMTSCVDLDSDKYFDDRTTLESVFDNKEQTEQWLAYAYSFLRGGNAEITSKGNTGGNGPNFNPFCFDDDMYYGDRDRDPEFGGDGKDSPWASYNGFHEGLYNESVGQNSWEYCYKGIYQASVFIHNVKANTELTEAEAIDYRGQARFVRAYYYWLLLRKYGPVPIMPDEGADYSQSYDDLAFPRNTYEEVADYISSEMIQAAKELRYYKRDEANIGRPTKGAALATRAIALTYAASPLANGQLTNGKHPDGVTDDIAKMLVSYDGTPLLSRNYDEKKWAKAAAACRDVIELTNNDGNPVYELYHHVKVEQPDEWMPVTVTPPDDGDFSTKNWPDGYADIDPCLSYRDLFNGTMTAADNPEHIFGRITLIGTGDNDLGLGAFVMHSMPASLNGWNTHGLTQKMCDTYYQKDGSDIPGMYREWRHKYNIEAGNDEPRVAGFINRNEARMARRDYPELMVGSGTTKVENVPKMYANREPRFYASVSFNGCQWECQGHTTQENRNKQVFYYYGTADGQTNGFAWLRTGIGVKKYANPYDWVGSRGNYSNIRQKAETAIRYADILLLYAEALNELGGSYDIPSWDGTKTYQVSRNIDEMKRGVRPVRCRAGLPDYTAAEYADKDAFRAKIKRERMIEFMGEAKRYFDLRRWMDAPIEESMQIYGLDTYQPQSNREQFMDVIPCTKLRTVFADKMYFWPISHTELKRNKHLTQNPGWTYND